MSDTRLAFLQGAAALDSPLCWRAGQPIPRDWPFVVAFSFFRLAAIAEGVARRALQGNASSENAAQAGAMTALLADLGLQALDAPAPT